MKKLSWREIKRGLSDQRMDGKLPDSGAFWADFKARARLRVSEAFTMREKPSLLPALLFPRWAVATACALLTVTWLGLHLVRQTQNPGPNRINSLEVIASHSAILIMNDEQTESTILWVVDMETDNDNGGSI